MARSRKMFALFLTTSMLGMTLLLGTAPKLRAQDTVDGAEAPASYGEDRAHRGIRWTSPTGDGVASGLYLLELHRLGMVSRLLAEDVGGRLVLITSTLDGRQGQERIEFRDEATGWWVRLEVDMGLRSANLGAFFAAARELEPGQGRRVRLQLLSRDGVRFERELDLADPEELYRRFADELVAADQAEPLTAGMPPGLNETVFFLDASMSPSPWPSDSQDNVAFSLRPVIEVLAHVLDERVGQATAGPREPWAMTVGSMEKGTGLVDPEQLAFVSRFRSVENADPLSDHRAALVFADPGSDQP